MVSYNACDMENAMEDVKYSKCRDANIKRNETIGVEMPKMTEDGELSSGASGRERYQVEILRKTVWRKGLTRLSKSIRGRAISDPRVARMLGADRDGWQEPNSRHGR